MLHSIDKYAAAKKRYSQSPAGKASQKKASAKHYHENGGKEKQSALYQANKKQYAERHLMRKYGITMDDWNSMFDAQGGCCGICERHQTEFKRTLVVDHCHETGAIRGLLCTNCNTAIGRLGDNLEGLQKAIKYLEKN